MPVTRFSNLQLADQSRRWSAAAAEKRVRKWAGAEDAPNAKYRRAHLWYETGRAHEFTGYKLPIADVVDGELKAVPRAIISAAAVVDGARGGVDVPDSDRPKLRRQLDRYYDKMGETAPWKSR